MSRYALGAPIYLSTTITDRTGTLVNAGTLTLVVQNPDLTQQTFSTPTNDSTGQYHQDIPAADLVQLGHYQYVWTSTGAGAGVSRGEFDVFDPFEPEILPLADAKQACNIPAATTTYDVELQVYVDTIAAALEAVTGGPAYNRTVTERCPITENYGAVVLRQRPVVSVTSITDIASGTAMSLADIEIDTNAGIVRRKRHWPFVYWGTSGYQVVYVAGWGTAIPAAFNAAARIIIAHLWETQRGPGQHPLAGMDETFLPGMSYAIPNRALELMRPYTIEAYV